MKMKSERVSEGQVRCACGSAVFDLVGTPILATECYCDSCRSAGAIFENEFEGRSVVSAQGATQFVLYKKTRVRPRTDASLLEFRLKPESSTRRIVAGCCGTPIFLDFQQGHWLSVYARNVQPKGLVSVEERTMLSDMPDDWEPPRDDIRNSNRQSAIFFAKLLWAWVSMGFRTPKIDWVSGKLEL